VAFPSFHQLTSVDPALLTGILGFGALRVDDPIARRGGPGFFFGAIGSRRPGPLPIRRVYFIC
jgi:hypothetical protein